MLFPTISRGVLQVLTRQARIVGTRASHTAAAAFASNTHAPCWSWTESLSFASPESDFTSSQSLPSAGSNVATAVGNRYQSSLAAATDSTHTVSPAWSQTLSFASPESDFVAASPMNNSIGESFVLESKKETSSAFAAVADQSVWSGAFSFASPESDFCANASPPARHVSLPQSFREALLEEHAALVVTTATAPHRIVHVNHAWEDLCGFDKKEALHRSLNILQGPDTRVSLTQRMVERLLATHDPQEVYVVNYNKQGEAFTNHLRAGYIQEDNGLELLVGILEPVQRQDVPLRLVRD